MSVTLVIGIGNEQCGDDAVGPLVARRIEARRLPGIQVHAGDLDPLGLIDLWKTAQSVILIDAMSSGRTAGAIDRFEAHAQPLPSGPFSHASTHSMGVPEAIELSRALQQFPPHFVVYAVEGRNFDAGAPLSTRVQSAIPRLEKLILRELRSTQIRKER